MFEQTDFFSDNETAEVSRGGRMMGQVGSYGLHAAKVLFLIYSGYHGISASLSYVGTSEIAKAAQVFGIVVLEITLLAIYLAWHNQEIKGRWQMLAAAVTYLILFTLAILGIVGDSQLHAGFAVSGWLQAYLLWGLPAAPAIAAFGALLTHELAPEQLRARRQAEEQLAFADERFDAYMAMQRADMKAQKSLANAQLGAKMAAASQIAAWANSPDARAMINRTAMNNAPSILAAIGVDVSAVPDVNGDGQLDAEDVAAFLERNPEKAAQFFGEARRRRSAQPAVDPDIMATIRERGVPHENGRFNGANGSRPTNGRYREES